MQKQSVQKQSIQETYGKFFKLLFANSVAAAKIDSSNVYQPANMRNRKIMYKLVKDNLLPASGLGEVDNFLDFYAQVKGGKSGLILMEHYSNTDLPTLLYLLEKSGNDELKDLALKTVAIAGMKLNEENPIVRAFAESFTRIVIYPSRSLFRNEKKAMSEEEIKEEEAKARKINFAAMRAMDACKKRGEVILVFPSGTRYRPGHPETKRGVPEIESYLRLFDVAICVSVNGSLLEIQETGEEGSEDMLSDLICKDKVVLTASPVIDCKKFRSSLLVSLPEDESDPKQKVVDALMQILEDQHERVEKIRLV